MPAYDFRCTSCGTTCEVVRPASDTAPVACPECGGQTKRVFTPVGVVFKGSGFYNTDYKNKSASPATIGTPKKGSDSAPKSEPSCPGSGGAGCGNCPAA